MSDVMTSAAILFASIFGALLTFALMNGIAAVVFHIADGVYGKIVAGQNEKFHNRIRRFRELPRTQTIMQARANLYPRYRYAVINTNTDRVMWACENMAEARRTAHATSELVYIIDLKGVVK